MPEQEVNEDESGSLPAALPAAAAGRGLERPDLAHDGHGGGRADDPRPGVGILRTMPSPDEGAVERFRRASRALGVEWQPGTPYGEFLRTLDRDDPKHLALIHEATSLFRGAGYTPFDGELPEHPEHAAVAAPYAHVTAPLRRLVDRFGLVISEAVSEGREVPGWVREALPTLPEAMTASDRKAAAVERACSDAVEAAALADRVGEEFDAMVVDQREKGGAVDPDP